MPNTKFLLSTVALALLCACSSQNAGKGRDAHDSRVGQVGEALLASITLDGTNRGLPYAGIGALTQGGQQRLLYDYPEPQRSQILDYLFCSPFSTPAAGYCTNAKQYGAAFQALKVEIGGDHNEAEGAEPSIAHTANDAVSCHYRGYEWWLMKQAQLRNPNITFEALPWGIPGWLGNDRTYIYLNGDSYVVDFLQCAKRAGLDISYVGLLNEDNETTGLHASFAQSLQLAIASAKNPSLSTRIVCCDDFNSSGSAGNGWNPWVQQMDPNAQANPPGQNETQFYNAVDVIGVHYPRPPQPANVDPFLLRSWKPAWATEETVAVDWKDLWGSGPTHSTRLIGEWLGAPAIAQTLIRDYFTSATTRWDIIFYLNGFYDSLYAPGAGFISADAPWAGHYDIQPALWAIAHFGQFASPGWTNLGGPGSGCLDGDPSHGCFDPSKPDTGRYMSLTDGTNYSLIAETTNASQAYTVNFAITGGLSTGQVHVWSSTASGQLVQLPDPMMTGNTFNVTFQPGSIYTVTTLTGRGKLNSASPLQQTAFPVNYSDSFDGYGIGDSDPGDTAARNIPYYLSTLEGSFELTPSATCGNGSQCLSQMAPMESYGQFGSPGEEPYAVIGDRSWTDYSVSAKIEFPSGSASTAAASVQGRIESVVDEVFDFSRHGGYEFRIQEDGNWRLRRHYVNVVPNGANYSFSNPDLATGKRTELGTNAWHTIKISFQGSVISLYVDAAPLATCADTYQLPNGWPALASGMAAIGSSWDVVRFDNLSIQNFTSADYDDHATGFNYQGSWGQCSCPSNDLDYNGTITSSNTANDTVTFPFTGTGVILFGAKATNGGFADVSVLNPDGTTYPNSLQHNVDFFHEARTVGNQVVYTSPVLPAGTYSLKVTVNGTGQQGQTPIGAPGVNYVHIDRVTVVPSSTSTACAP
jgi:hypothetical protein